MLPILPKTLNDFSEFCKPCSGCSFQFPHCFSWVDFQKPTVCGFPPGAVSKALYCDGHRWESLPSALLHLWCGNPIFPASLQLFGQCGNHQPFPFPRAVHLLPDEGAYRDSCGFSSFSPCLGFWLFRRTSFSNLKWM